MQSICFESTFKSDKNLVISAPTGCGKTVILELALLRLIDKSRLSSNMFNNKVVYIAPTKALCSEKSREWNMKFNYLNLKVKEITGDLPFDGRSNILDIKNADVIITTVR